MRLPDDEDERGVGAPVVYTIIGVSVFILIVLAAVMVSDSRRTTDPARRAASTPTPTPTKEAEMYQGQSDADFEMLYRENKLRSEDLDFWDMYSGRDADIQ
ncbi:MAG: hypothetical protein K2G19_02165, partial [Lachnospiraceae bacterium]|nr:hypothetical protein [Lachnospiraceae bacterium]